MEPWLHTFLFGGAACFTRRQSRHWTQQHRASEARTPSPRPLAAVHQGVLSHVKATWRPDLGYEQHNPSLPQFSHFSPEDKKRKEGVGAFINCAIFFATASHSQRLHSIGDTAEAQAAHHSSISRSKCVSLQWSRPYRLSIPIFSGTLSRLIPLFHEGKNWDLGQKKRIILLFPSEKKTIYTYQLAPLFSGIKWNLRQPIIRLGI